MPVQVPDIIFNVSGLLYCRHESVISNNKYVSPWLVLITSVM